MQRVQEACVCDIEYKRKEWEMYIKESSKLKKEGRKRSGGQVVISGKEPKHKKIANPPCDVKTEEVHSGKVKNLLPAHTHFLVPPPILLKRAHDDDNQMYPQFHVHTFAHCHFSFLFISVYHQVKVIPKVDLPHILA